MRSRWPSVGLPRSWQAGGRADGRTGARPYARRRRSSSVGAWRCSPTSSPGRPPASAPPGAMRWRSRASAGWRPASSPRPSTSSPTSGSTGCVATSADEPAVEAGPPMLLVPPMMLAAEVYDVSPRPARRGAARARRRPMGRRLRRARARGGRAGAQPRRPRARRRRRGRPRARQRPAATCTSAATPRAECSATRPRPTAQQGHRLAGHLRQPGRHARARCRWASQEIAVRGAGFLVDRVLAPPRGWPAWASRAGFRMLEPGQGGAPARGLRAAAARPRRAAAARAPAPIPRRRAARSPRPAGAGGLHRASSSRTTGCSQGGFVVGDRLVTLADVSCPVLCFVGTVDEIAPAPAVRPMRPRRSAGRHVRARCTPGTRPGRRLHLPRARPGRSSPGGRTGARATGELPRGREPSATRAARSRAPVQRPASATGSSWRRGRALGVARSVARHRGRTAGAARVLGRGGQRASCPPRAPGPRAAAHAASRSGCCSTSRPSAPPATPVSCSRTAPTRAAAAKDAHRRRRARPALARRAPGRARRRADEHAAERARGRRRAEPPRRRRGADAPQRETSRARSSSARHTASSPTPSRPSRVREAGADQVLVLGGGGAPRDLGGEIVDMERIDPDAVACPRGTARTRPRERPGVCDVHRRGRAHAPQPDHQRPLGAVGVRHRLVRRA